jgi:hypothetical protein
VKYPVAKHMNTFNRASVEPHKRRSKLEAMELQEMEEDALEGIVEIDKDVLELNLENNEEVTP